MVVMAFNISQTWNPKKRVTKKPNMLARVCPKSNKNIFSNGASGTMEAFIVLNMFQITRWQAIAE